MRSGQKAVTTAGTAVQMTSVRGEIFAVVAMPTNTGVVYLGSDSSNLDVASTSGYPLSPGQSVTFACADLSELWLDAATNGDKVAWLRLA